MRLASNIKNDNKSFYRYVRSKSKTKDVVSPLKDVDGRIITDDLMMSNVSNQFFSSVFTNENSEAPEVAMRAVDDQDQGVYDITITRDMVKSRIEKLKEGNASGDDGLTPVFLKMSQRKYQSLWLRYLTGLLTMVLCPRIGKWQM